MHKQITQAQYDIWIDDPVTKIYLQCLEWSAEQQEEVVGNGGFIVQENNDLSMNRIQYALGVANGHLSSANPKYHIERHEMLEVKAA